MNKKETEEEEEEKGSDDDNGDGETNDGGGEEERAVEEPSICEESTETLRGGRWGEEEDGEASAETFDCREPDDDVTSFVFSTSAFNNAIVIVAGEGCSCFFCVLATVLPTTRFDIDDEDDEDDGGNNGGVVVDTPETSITWCCADSCCCRCNLRLAYRAIVTGDK